ncbi:uncharacterized protein LOC133055538 [Dama dama]|uniref:uncharacterized protein LOC133055538 n=1 Tax=Dama dama TaxID=30532 RepID=UPI002A36E930|nr:uncharacterized protein LOC133055538 [Dama dama]
MTVTKRTITSVGKALPKPSPSSCRVPPTLQHPRTRSLRASFTKRGSIRRSLDARVTEPVFVLFKNQIPVRAQPPHSRGNRGKWQRGAGVERENKRMTEYNLPCQLAAEGRKGKRRLGGPTAEGTAPQPSTPPHAAAASRVPPRRRPPPPALPGPPRTQTSCARPIPRAGVCNLFPQPCSAPRAPRGRARRAPSPFSKSSSPTVAPGHSAPCPSSRPVSPPQPPENPPQTPEQTTQAPGGGAEGGGGTRDGKPFSPHPPRSPPPTSLGGPRSYLLSASPGKTAASLSLLAGPRTSRRRRRGVRREPGPPRLPEPLHWERRRQNSGAPPRAEPPARATPPTPQPPRRRRRH